MGQEITCFHKKSNSLIVTDALVAISYIPSELFDLDPAPLLFHSRERGDEPLIDTSENRLRGWLRLVLFATYLRPSVVSIPSISYVIKYAFKDGANNPRSHFGIYPFIWDKHWEKSALELVGK